MPLNWLLPVGVEVAFDERTYGLGEIIAATVKLSAGREVEVRVARLELVCEERYAESYTVSVPSGPPTDYGSPWGQFGVYRAPKIPKKVDRDVKETFVHSSAVFLEGALLNAGSAKQFSFDLCIGAERPPHASVGSSTWLLQLVVDVARARDVRVRLPVDVTVPLMPKASSERLRPF